MTDHSSFADRLSVRATLAPCIQHSVHLKLDGFNRAVYFTACGKRDYNDELIML